MLANPIVTTKQIFLVVGIIGLFAALAQDRPGIDGLDSSRVRGTVLLARKYSSLKQYLTEFHFDGSEHLKFRG